MTGSADPTAPPATGAAPPRAGRREWLGLAVLSLPALLVMMDLTLLHLAVPELTADLRPSATQLLWITDIYGFLIAGFLITMGTLGDRIGRRRLLLIGAALFGLASVLAAFATGPGTLIAARALLGIAGATLAPSTLALIRVMFVDDQQRSVAVSVWATSFLVGGASGPLIGGVLLEHFWWGSVFLVAVPAMVLLLVMGPLLLPEYRDTTAGRLDLLSVVLLLAAVLPVIYGVKQFAAGGAPWPAAAAVLAGLVIGVLFVRRQRALASPLLDLRLFATRTFTTSLIALTVAVVFMLGVQFLIAQHLQLVIGLSPLRAGLWMLPMIAAGVVGALGAPRLLARTPRPYVVGAGLAVAALGLLLLTGVGGDGALPLVVAGSGLMFLGLTPVQVLGMDMIVGAAPPERAGTAAALTQTSQEFGGALGIALLGSIAVTVYRSATATALPPGLPPATDAAARDTLPAAVGAAGQIPDPLRPEVLDTVREAFMSGLRVDAGIGAAVVGALALTAFLVLRPRRGDAAETAEPHPADAEAGR